MTNDSGLKVPTWFWVVGVLCLIWNLMGVMAFIAQVGMSAETLAAMPEAERKMYENTPMWATVAFGFAVFAGALGCIALLMRKAWALPLFILSLVGVLVQMYHAFFVIKSFEVFGPGAVIMPIMVIILAIFLIWLAQHLRGRGWLT